MLRPEIDELRRRPPTCFSPASSAPETTQGMDQEALQGESGVESVDAAAETDPTKGSATAPPSRAAVQPAQVQGHVDARYWHDPFYADDRKQALTERLLLVLTGSSSLQAASGQLPEARYFTLGMLQAVDTAVERV